MPNNIPKQKNSSWRDRIVTVVRFLLLTSLLLSLFFFGFEIWHDGLISKAEIFEELYKIHDEECRKKRLSLKINEKKY